MCERTGWAAVHEYEAPFATRWVVLELGDRLDQVLVDRHEVGPILVVDQHVSQADEQPLLFVDRVGHAIAHGRDEKIPDIDTVHRSNADANLFPLGHGSLRPLCRDGLSSCDARISDAGAT